jgi:multidrug efflux pump subunit AcrA (membrane-fusion protein)
MSIANLTDMIITAHINQADVIRLAPGQDVDVQVESVPGLKLRGKLDRVAPQALVKNGIKGFAARVSLKEIDPRVRPGMTAILNIPISSADNVLALPLSAVFSDRGERYVFVQEGGEFVRRPVTVGLTDYFYAEIQDGLTVGDVVSLQQVVDTKAGLPTGPRPVVARNGLSPSSNTVNSATAARRNTGS